ncbi:MAG: dihydrolipoamide acetyltransferase family protein [Eubacteriales bacterium]|nr:dihydrolipoamide acetyltransferase family protein [Eubacteriales bacterium]
MASVIIMPKLGYTQEEGSLMAWHKQPGETVKKGEAFFDVQTDKSIITVEAATEGTLLKIVVEPDTTVPVFTPLAVVGEAGEDADAALKAHGAKAAADAPAVPAFDAPSAAPAEAPAPAPEKLRLTPKARRLVREEGYDPASLRDVRGTGFEGGITAKDILASPLARRIAQDKGVDLRGVRGSGSRGKIMRDDVLRAVNEAAGSPDKRIAGTTPYAGVRRIIGERLSESKFTAPHLYFADSVDTTKLSAFRALINAESGYRVSVSDLLIAAACRALQKYPELNASLQGDQIVRYESVNIGTAVAGEAGLIVPVVKNVQEKSLREIAAETRELFARAQKGRLRPEEYSGGTFSISNLGMFGIEDFTAIINPPELAILAVSSIRKKPVVVTDEDGTDRIAIRPMMNIRLSVDHRVIDGLLAAQFVGCLKRHLEEPTLLLL